MNQEWMEGRLCEKGYMKEKFDNEKNDLVRSITDRGYNELRKMLLEKEWQKKFVMLVNSLKMPSEDKKEIVKIALNKLYNSQNGRANI